MLGFVRAAVVTIALAAGLLSGAMSQANAQETAPVVATTSGRIDGRTLATGVQAYLGIPYGAPPVRELRWREPQRPGAWAGVFHADRFGPQCPQPQRGVLTNQYSGAETISEDCLYLNVWTKPGVKNAPVIVYLHGGAFFIGSSSMPLYGGEAVAEQGAVVVSVNYRLGVLGFLAHPELSAESPHKSSGNYGLLDQVAALQWVRDNISQFGGDPAKVTIVGQSAGAMAVSLLQSSPLAKGLFHRAVGMSGGWAMGAAPRMPSLSDGEAQGARVQELLKAGGVAQMRNLPADRLQVVRPGQGVQVGPIVDGYFLPSSPDEIFRGSEQSDVPLLAGFAQDEALGPFAAVKDLASYRALARDTFGDRAGDFLRLYPASNDQEARRQARLADRDRTFVSAVHVWAAAQAGNGKAPVFTYEFARSHSYAPGVSFADLDPATAGAYHTSEVPFWLGSLESFNRYRRTRNWTDDDRAFSLGLTQALIAFASTGDPSTPGSTWPRFDPSKPRLRQLGLQSKIATWPDARKLDFFLSAATAPMALKGARD
jgi:para-nitrobenzyl esterase